jgi:hypothetical protein
MSQKIKLSEWVKQFIEQITREWDWKVHYSIDEPEQHQSSYQIFLNLKKLQLSVVILFDKQAIEVFDAAALKEKINLGLMRLKELAEELVIT